VGVPVAELIPLAVGVALSPVPVIAAMLVLLSRRASDASAGFLVGWIAGVGGVSCLFAILESRRGSQPGAGASPTLNAWLAVGLGAAVAFTGVLQWQRRPRSPAETRLPRWLAAVDSLSWMKAAALGLALVAVNPKNLLLCAAAGTELGKASGGSADQALGILFFTVLGTATVSIPVVSYLVARDRMRGGLDAARRWVELNSAPVSSVVLVAIGLVLFMRGLTSVSG
jgi:hypothetical protein